jgi:hypothetical protein
MAISGQPATRPGGFTFDDIPNASYVRNELAVKMEWKPDIDRVITYEVKKPLPVKIGAVGPQVDKGKCICLVVVHKSKWLCRLQNA